MMVLLSFGEVWFKTLIVCHFFWACSWLGGLMIYLADLICTCWNLCSQLRAGWPRMAVTNQLHSQGRPSASRLVFLLMAEFQEQKQKPTNIFKLPFPSNLLWSPWSHTWLKSGRGLKSYRENPCLGKAIHWDLRTLFNIQGTHAYRP